MPVTSPRARRIGGLLARFRAARGGNVATIFALASVPLVAFSGAAIDYGFATRQQSKLQASVDATALALCQTPNTATSDSINAQAQTTMAGYMATAKGPDPSLVVNYPTVVPATQTTARTIRLVANINSGTYFGNFTGVTAPKVGASSQCATPIPATFEIALVLDNTGSMSESSGNQSKIAALQVAAKKFVSYVQQTPTFSPQTRFSIVPFAAAVAVDAASTSGAAWVDSKGQSSYHWTNIDKSTANKSGFTSRLDIFNALAQSYGSWAWAGCFETLPYPQNVQDVAPSTGASQASYDTLYVPMLAPDEPGPGNTSYNCWGPNGSTSCKDSSATALVINSYIDDTSPGSTCPASTDFITSEKQACKYKTRSGASSSNTPNGPNSQCVSKPMQRLTSNATTLNALISSMTAAGSTNIHDGLMWGWRTISPNGVFATADNIAPYKSATTNKVLILMTDGTNSWSTNNPYNSYNGNSTYFTFGYLKNADGSTPTSRLPSGYQDVSTSTNQRAALDELTAEACTNMKTAGVSVWTIGFSVPQDPIDNQGLQLLKNCASNSGQAFVANNSDDIVSAFTQIAKSIGALRLSQ